MHIVLVTSGSVAVQFAVELSRDNDVSVVLIGGEGREEYRTLDVEIREGRGGDIDILREARTADAAYFIAWTRQDEVNVLSSILARQLGAKHTICFIENEEYARSFGAGKSQGATDLGIDTLVWPAFRLAEKIEQILAVPGATDVGSFAGGQVRLLEFRLRGMKPLVGRPLMEIKSLPPGALIAAVTRGDEWFVPRGQSVLAKGDRVLFMGRAKAMRELAAWFSEHLPDSEKGEVVIVGGGSVGLRLAKSMERNKRARLKLIENRADRCAEIAGILEHTLVLQGDGSDLHLFEAEEVRYARALVAVTDSDEKNLLVSLLGRSLGIPKIVTRVSNSANRRVFERVGIDVPLSTAGAATEAVLHMVRHEKVDLLATIGEGQGDVLEITLPEGFKSGPLAKVHLPPDTIVAAAIRNGKAIVPRGNTTMHAGDRCIVICKVERVEEVRKILLQ